MTSNSLPDRKAEEFQRRLEFASTKRIGNRPHSKVGKTYLDFGCIQKLAEMFRKERHMSDCQPAFGAEPSELKKAKPIVKVSNVFWVKGTSED